MVTRQQSQRRDLEAQDEQQSGLSNENLQSLLRKLAYFNRATDEILRGNSKEAYPGSRGLFLLFLLRRGEGK